MVDVFITGGTGYVGKFLIDSLLDEKDIKTLKLLARSREKAFLQLSNLIQKANKTGKNIIILKGDIIHPNLGLSNSEIKSLESIDEVYHLASVVSLSKDTSKREDIINTNFVGTKNILDVFKDSENLKKFFYFSTAYACGKTSKLVNEEWLEKPADFRNYYEESKWLSEKLISEYHKMYKIKYIVFRPGIIAGLDVSNLEELGHNTIYKYGYIIHKAFNLQNGYESKIRLVGSKLSTLNIIPIDHIIKLVMGIRSSNKNNMIFNLTNEKNCTCNSVVEGVQESLNFEEGYMFNENLDFTSLSDAERLTYQFTKPFWGYTLGGNIEWSTDNTKYLRRKLGLVPIDNLWIKNHLKMYFKQVEKFEKEKPNLQV